MSLIRKHVAVLQAWACLDLVSFSAGLSFVLEILISFTSLLAKQYITSVGLTIIVQGTPTETISYTRND